MRRLGSLGEIMEVIKEIKNGCITKKENQYFVLQTLFAFAELEEVIQEELITEWYCFQADAYLEIADDQFGTEHQAWLEENQVSDWSIIYDDGYSSEIECISIGENTYTDWNTILGILLTDEPEFKAHREIIQQFLTKYQDMVEKATDWSRERIIEDLSRLRYTKGGEGYEIN
jgi:hypothetical protein